LASHGSPSRALGRYPALDGIRAIAAIAVVLTHIGYQSGEGLNGPARSVLSRLDVGVAVFFVLSGFLLHRPQARAAFSGRPLPAVGPYLWHRALRILPAYWLAVVAALVILPENGAAGAADWLRQMTLTQVYRSDDLLPGLTQTWSLATEVTFYLALPLLGRLAGRTLRSQLRLCGLMFATGLVWQGLIAAGTLPPQAGYWLPGHADWFAIGMAMAALSAAGTEWFSTVAADGLTCWVGAAALYVVAGTPLTGPYSFALLTPVETLSRTLLYGGVAALLLLPATLPVARGLVMQLLASPPAAFVGRISYGVFLLHLTVLSVALDGLGIEPFTGHFWTLATVVIPVSLLVAWASLQTVEQPAMRLKDRGPGAPRQPRPAVATSRPPDRQRPAGTAPARGAPPEPTAATAAVPPALPPQART
jgi:peptidoglycan/LPS O-acetylase OafA/YrhL